MKRRIARECALQFLFRIDFLPSYLTSADGETLPFLSGEIDDFWTFLPERSPDMGAYADDPDVREYAGDLITGVIEHLSTIDAVIVRVAANWKISRMAAVDRSILRMAVYEILFLSEIPGAVTIDEALDIAKKYSTSESPSFINGILDRVVKESGTKRMHA